MMLKKTRTIDGITYTVTYGFDTKFAAKHNQRPYFSITLDVTEGKRWVSGGADSDTIAKVFPELANVLQWHLADNSATPMHYVLNTLYWRDHFPTQAAVHFVPARGEAYPMVTVPPKYEDRYSYGPERLVAHLKGCMAWGALPSEREWTGASPETWGRDTLRVYLLTRQAALMDNMRADLAAVGVTVPTKLSPPIG